jgi:hypothetical protein
MSSKRQKVSVPGFLTEHMYKDNEDGIRTHKSLVMRKKQILLLKEFYDSCDIKIEIDGKGMIIKTNCPMTDEELTWQKERMSVTTSPHIDSIEEYIPKIHHKVWENVLFNMAKYLDLSQLEPTIEFKTNGQCIAVGEMKYVNLAQLMHLNNDKNFLDYRLFFRNGNICIMVDVNVKH